MKLSNLAEMLTTGAIADFSTTTIPTIPVRTYGEKKKRKKKPKKNKKAISEKKVRLISTDDPYTGLKPGAIGVLRSINNDGLVEVTWEDGKTLSLIPGIDKFRVI